MENALSLTRFIATLGCKLRIGYYWSAKSEDNSRIIFTIWADQLENGRYLLWPNVEPMPAWTRLSGAHEWHDHIEIALKGNVEILGVLCHAVDSSALPRLRDYYDEKSIFVMNIGEHDGNLTAVVVGEVDVDVARNGKVSEYISPHKSALDDLFDSIPEGVESPETTPLSGVVFRRDQMVRSYVLSRAHGYCEYCGKEGFLMPSGKKYLEAHHIIALSCQGPDKVNNVIALCADHHREAHFGVDKEQLNAGMLQKLSSI
ncbi:MAG: HNH endonuclease signature motif containing protein [Methylotenera sp.]|nr:HNH endonuclease signature motif containing protein [Methylotenera sp.]